MTGKYLRSSGRVALIASLLLATTGMLSSGAFATDSRGVVVEPVSKLMDPLDVWVTLPRDFAADVAVRSASEPVFSDSAVDGRYVQRYMNWELMRAENDGRLLLHLTSVMGVSEPAFTLDILPVGASNSQPLQVVIALDPAGAATGAAPGAARVLATGTVGQSVASARTVPKVPVHGMSASSKKVADHGMSASSKKVADHGMSASSKKVADHGMSASSKKVTDHGMSASSKKAADHGMSASSKKGADHGMSASSKKVADHGMSASSKKVADHGMSASSKKTADHGMSASSKKTDHGMSASEKKSADHGMSTSEKKRADHGMSASEKKDADHGMSASAKKVPAYGMTASTKDGS